MTVYRSRATLNAITELTGVSPDHDLWDPLFNEKTELAEDTSEDLFVIPAIFLEPGDYDKPSSRLAWGAEIGPAGQSVPELLHGRRLAIARGVTALAGVNMEEYRTQLLSTDSTTLKTAGHAITRLAMYAVRFGLEYREPEIRHLKPVVIQDLKPFAYPGQTELLERLVAE